MGEWFDMIVVGGGPAGATAAGLLARRGMRVAVCEGKKFPREKVCGEFMGIHLRPVLAELGLLERFDALAGPEIRRVRACSGEREIVGAMPGDAGGIFPRAMCRGAFDAMLLERAREMGATVREGCHVQSVAGDERRGFSVASSAGQLHSRAVVLAHGSPVAGGLDDGAQQTLKREYVSFKTHLTGVELLDETTIAIGGATGIYAGLVKTSDARYALAFVVRRDRLGRFGNTGAQQLGALAADVPAFRRMLHRAQRAGPWMASGPLEPGARRLFHAGRFFVGNAAGEVHALVGEGITLAMLGAKTLAESLLSSGADLEEAAERYASEWRKLFFPRWRAAGLFVGVMMRPWIADFVAPLMESHPELLTACARLSGK